MQTPPCYKETSKQNTCCQERKQNDILNIHHHKA